MLGISATLVSDIHGRDSDSTRTYDGLMWKITRTSVEVDILPMIFGASCTLIMLKKGSL